MCAFYADLGVDVKVSGGVRVLGAPVGSPAFRKKFSHERVEALLRTFRNLSLLEDAEVSLAILHACLGASRVMHLLRVVPPAVVQQPCLVFERAQRLYLSKVFHNPLPNTMWEVSQ